jgi:sulfatase modifying factor 1
MLNNLRRKRVQRIDIEEGQYANAKSDAWWKGVVVGYKDTSLVISKQRYSKKKITKPFDYYLDTVKKVVTIRNYVNSMILCSSGSLIKEHEQESDNKPEKMKIEKSFLLGETEITQELYCAVMNVKNPSRFQDNPKKPVEMVSWYDALIFCNKLSDIFGLDRYYTITKKGKIIDTIEEEQNNYKVETNKNSKGFRLPTEWEWEYAAKAESPFLYSGSDDVNEVGWYDGNSRVKGEYTTHPVKKKKPNAWGFYDMSGNVSEWCENTWNSTSADRVRRGGSWISDASYLRSATRYYTSPGNRGDSLGFRVCRYI